MDEVLYQVNKTYLDAAKMINDQIDNNFGDSADNVRDANKKGIVPLLNVVGQDDCF